VVGAFTCGACIYMLGVLQMVVMLVMDSILDVGVDYSVVGVVEVDFVE